MTEAQHLRDTVETLDAAIERAILEGAVRAIDRRAAALRADTRDDPATLARRAGTALLLEDCANDIAALAGPIAPLQGTLALPSPVGSHLSTGAA